MPTYQYACTECGHAFEIVQSFSDDALTACTRCEGRLRKVFSSVGIVFKGSGFYRNDSREAAKNGASAGEKSDTGGEKSDKADKGDKVSADKGSETKKTGAPATDKTKGDKPAKKADSGGSSPARTPAASGSSTPGRAT